MPFSINPFARASSSADAIRRRHEAETRDKRADNNTPRIRVGVCAMDKKANSKPMKAILKRMNNLDEFVVVTFGDDVILNKPVEQWPSCDALLAWHSDGFPLHKAQAYVRLKKPFVVNDVFKQNLLLDRRSVYKTLREHNIPMPHHIMVTRSEADVAAGRSPPGFVETDDYIEMDGVKIQRPFVEKPSDGDNHNIWIYYPNSMGGGVKTLFRKQNDKSAEYLSDHDGRVRRDGSFIYEEFLATGGTDVKVYTVGPRYAHAEARKSPVVDGKVSRTADGKEIRYPVLLSPAEKEIACAVSNAFQQKVCGFDLLRSDGDKAFVCDVNGWSFVKSSKKYYDDAAGLLRQFILEALAPHRFESLPHLPHRLHDDDLPNTVEAEAAVRLEEEKNLPDLTDLEAEMEHTNSTSSVEELRCVLAVIRHGDRTPKQKLKMTAAHPVFLRLFDKYADAKGKQAKLKAPDELAAFLEAVREYDRVVRAEAGGDDDADDRAPLIPPDDPPTDPAISLGHRLRIVRSVLENGAGFSGINRKVQLKPTAYADGPDGAVAAVSELQVIVKWGGVLTHLGRQQAEDLGYIYRMVMYPRSADGGGLLRLHSTYRHDLKIYSSDEGRVQTSAAAFIKGLLDLEGASLTPILVSLVNRDAAMLDAFGKGASADIIEAKGTLYRALTFDPATGECQCVQPNAQHTSPPPSPSTLSATSKGDAPNKPEATFKSDGRPCDGEAAAAAIPHLPTNPLQTLHELAAAIKRLAAAIRTLMWKPDAPFPSEVAAKVYSALNLEASEYQQDPKQPYGTETVLMMYDRWRKLQKSLFNPKDGTYDISKIPDIYDSIKYDCIHNSHLPLDYTEIYPLAKKLADCVIGGEYGVAPAQKLRIGSKIARELIGKLLLDLENVKSESFSVEQDLMQRAPAPHDAGDAVVRGGDEEVLSASLQGAENPDEPDRIHRLAPQYVNDINSPLRHVRTRIYFTSESHIHSLLNVLRYEDGGPMLSARAQRLLDAATEFDYLTQIVFRMYENKTAAADSPSRFRVEIQYSNGANFNPMEEAVHGTRPRTFIHRDEHVSLQEFQAHMQRWGTKRAPKSAFGELDATM